ncbi:anthrone oxygenase family protein [Streptosporangium sp. NPDC051023]|uniref:anthrone oxygenase family protein n=1 Tax=Streptosporangium sp. NPDC051023 TaxID=3155410 RepID=UPI00344E9070
MIKILQTVSLLAATVTTGLMAGLFAAFAYAVMPGLGRSHDRTFVEAMQKINVAIINGWFMFCFLGGLLFTIVALVLHLRSGQEVLPWIIAGFVLYAVMFVVTSAVNVPLNDQLAKAGHLGSVTDLAAVRQAFESRWVTWNIVRAVANIAAFAVLTWALVLHGRVTATATAAPGPGVGPGHGVSAAAPHLPGPPARYGDSPAF